MWFFMKSFIILYFRLKYRKVKSHTENDINFLEASIQLLYILGRLQYLRKIHTSDHKFTTFQESSIVCMQTQFTLLINKLTAIDNSEEEETNKLQNTIENFVLLITDEFEIIKFNEDSFGPKKEFCFMCNETINDFEKCNNDHKVTRCILSYTQVGSEAFAFIKNKIMINNYVNITTYLHVDQV